MFWNTEVAYKYKMTSMQAALGLAQLKKIDWMNEKRAEIARKYTEAFKGTKVIPPVVKADRETSWHLYVVKVNNRNELFEKLKENGIGTSVHFIPVHKHPYYKETYGYRDENFPVANYVFEKSLSLPIYPGLTDKELNYISETVLKYAK